MSICALRALLFVQVRSMPIRKDDEVRIMRGKKKGDEGRVTQVYRKKFVIYVERVTRQKQNGQSVPVPVHPSNCIITKLKMNKSRERILDRKERGKAQEANMDNVD